MKLPSGFVDHDDLAQTLTGENGHIYPDKYAPGPNAGWALNAAWEILDSLNPGVLKIDTRSYLAGMIAGRLMKARSGD